MVEFDGHLVGVQSGGAGLWLIDSQGSVTTSAWPANGGAVHQYNFNSLVVAGGALYVLATSKIWKLTAVGGEWVYHCDLGQDCVGIGYFPGVGLIVAGAQILKITL